MERQDDNDAAYFMRRARDEAHMALRALSPDVAAAHHGLAVRYTMEARRVRKAAEAPEPSAFPQLAHGRGERIELTVR
jgi:hypothetical protein